MAKTSAHRVRPDGGTTFIEGVGGITARAMFEHIMRRYPKTMAYLAKSEQCVR